MYGNHITYNSRVWNNRVIRCCQSCSWLAERGKKWTFPCPRSRLRIWSPDTGSAVPSRVILIKLHTRAESDRLMLMLMLMLMVLTHGGIPPDFRGDVHLFCTAIRHRVSPEFIRSSSNCVLVAFTAESPLAQGRQ